MVKITTLLFSALFLYTFNCNILLSQELKKENNIVQKNNLFLEDVTSGSPVIVTATSGTLSAGYNSLDLALAQVGALHSGVVSVKINVSHNLTATATIGNSNFTSCNIYPTTSLNLSTVLSGNVILLNGADNVTIDGRINAAGENVNSLSITNNNTSSGVRIVKIQNGSQNFTMRNVNITIPSPVTAVTGGRCVDIAQSTTSQQGGQDNATIKYCNLSGGDRTVQTFGSAGLNANYNTVFFGNKIRNFQSIGIFLGSEVIGCTVDSNEIYDDVSVYLGGSAGTNCRGISIQAHGNILIQNNIIHDLADNNVRTTLMSIQGLTCIPITSAAPIPNPVTNVTFQNNIVRLVQNNTRITSLYGMLINAAPIPFALDYNAKVYNNSCILGGTGTLTEETEAMRLVVPNVASVNAPSTAVYYNNVSMNFREGVAASKHVGMNFIVETGVATTSDYATCFSDGFTGIRYDAIDGSFGYVSTFSWRNANCEAGNEQHSAIHPVNYNASYRIDTLLNYGDLEGKVLPSVTKDIFGVTRPGTYPYRGAVEGPALKVLTVTAGLEGRTGPESSDIIVALYDVSCNFVDYATSYITDKDSSPKFIFSTAVSSGTEYSLQFLTSNNIESWGSGTTIFTPTLPNPAALYVFNDPGDIFGSNGTASGEFYGADVNQDGIVDATDQSDVENDVGISGCRISTDVTYDGIVDSNDQVITKNNVSAGGLSVLKCSPDS